MSPQPPPDEPPKPKRPPYKSTLIDKCIRYAIPSHGTTAVLQKRVQEFEDKNDPPRLRRKRKWWTLPNQGEPTLTQAPSQSPTPSQSDTTLQPTAPPSPISSTATSTIDLPLFEPQFEIPLEDALPEPGNYDDFSPLLNFPPLPFTLPLSASPLVHASPDSNASLDYASITDSGLLPDYVPQPSLFSAVESSALASFLTSSSDEESFSFLDKVSPLNPSKRGTSDSAGQPFAGLVRHSGAWDFNPVLPKGLPRLGDRSELYLSYPTRAQGQGPSQFTPIAPSPTPNEHLQALAPSTSQSRRSSSQSRLSFPHRSPHSVSSESSSLHTPESIAVSPYHAHKRPRRVSPLLDSGSERPGECLVEEKGSPAPETRVDKGKKRAEDGELRLVGAPEKRPIKEEQVEGMHDSPAGVGRHGKLLSDSKKRANHIQSEQKRRDAIKDGYSELSALLLQAQHPQPAPSFSVPLSSRPTASPSTPPAQPLKRSRAESKSNILERAAGLCNWYGQGNRWLEEEVVRIEALLGRGAVLDG